MTDNGEVLQSVQLKVAKNDAGCKILSIAYIQKKGPNLMGSKRVGVSWL